MGSNLTDVKDAAAFAEGRRSDLEALLQTLRCVGLHPSSLPGRQVCWGGSVFRGQPGVIEHANEGNAGGRV